MLSLLCAAAAIHPSAAQEAPDTPAAQDARIRHACAADYRKFCTGEDPAPAIERACLAQYFINLSAGCRAALHAGAAPQQGAEAGAP